MAEDRGNSYAHTVGAPPDDDGAARNPQKQNSCLRHRAHHTDTTNYYGNDHN